MSPPIKPDPNASSKLLNYIISYFSYAIMSSSHDTSSSLHSTLLDSYHKRRKGGAVISCGHKYMLAVEFEGSYGDGGVSCEMVYVDKNPQARAVAQQRGCERAAELGSNFLAGETIEYIETTSEDAFFSLLNKYKRNSSTDGYIDLKSGLRLYDAIIAK